MNLADAFHRLNTHIIGEKQIVLSVVSWHARFRLYGKNLSDVHIRDISLASTSLINPIYQRS